MSENQNHPPLRLGLIGAGPWGRNYIRTLKGLDGVRLSRLASRNPDSAGLVGPDCTISEDWRDVMETSGIELTIASVD